MDFISVIETVMQTLDKDKDPGYVHPIALPESTKAS